MEAVLSPPSRVAALRETPYGRLHAVRSGFLYVGTVADTITQRNSAMVWIALTDADFSLRTKKQSLPHVSAALVPPGYTHAHSGTAQVALLDVSPTDYHFRALARAAATVQVWPRMHFAALFEELQAYQAGDIHQTEAPQLWQRFLDLALQLVPAVKPLDPRVREVMRLLRTEHGRPIEELASAVDMSVDWLRHLFVTEAGIPLRKYEMTLRLQTAAAHIGRGTSLTQVAANAGFSDLAQFSKLWKLHYGFPPRRAFVSNELVIDTIPWGCFEGTFPSVETQAVPARASDGIEPLK